MKVKHIINHLVEKGTWVDWDETRDIILSGTDSLDIEKIGVCWVATNKVIEQAIKQNIHLSFLTKILFIICLPRLKHWH